MPTALWEAVKTFWNKEPYAIHPMLAETSVRASDRRAVFLGIDAHKAVGRDVLYDLFQNRDGGRPEDAAVLDGLVTEKLEVRAKALTIACLKWVEGEHDLPCNYSHGLRRLADDPAPMNDEETAAHVRLLAEYRDLKKEYSSQDENPEEIDVRNGEFEIAMDTFEARPLIFDLAAVDRAGTYMTLERDASTAFCPKYV